jgi:hypothetical protein
LSPSACFPFLFFVLFSFVICVDSLWTKKVTKSSEALN